MTDPTAGLRIRTAVRAVLLDPTERVLLVRFDFPSGEVRWALPGGGVEPGETFTEALHRELIEEVGLHHPDIGPLVWIRTHVIPLLALLLFVLMLPAESDRFSVDGWLARRERS